MTRIDPIAAYAAIVATGALFLEVRRWAESGPRLVLSCMPNALVSGESKEKKRIALNIANVGNSATTLKVMVLYDYDSWFRRLVGKPLWTAIIPRPDLAGYPPSMPMFLEPGKTWTGLVDLTEELKRRIQNGHLFVGVSCSHRRKVELVHVRPINDAQDSQ